MLLVQQHADANHVNLEKHLQPHNEEPIGFQSMQCNRLAGNRDVDFGDVGDPKIPIHAVEPEAVVEVGEVR